MEYGDTGGKAQFIGPKAASREVEPNIQQFLERIQTLCARAEQITSMLCDKANTAFGYRGEKAADTDRVSPSATLANTIASLEFQMTLLHEEASRF